MVRKPAPAHGLARATTAIGPGSDIGLATIDIDSGHKVNLDNIQHVVHEDFPVKA